jgi:FkbM family methyltransferase
MGLEAIFHVADEVELRTVELAFHSEKELLQLVLRELQAGDTFLDVGANLGLFSVFAGLAHAKVIACEPEPIAFDRLQRNLAANHLDSVRLFPAALSDHAGTANFTKASKKDIKQIAHLSPEGTETIQLTRGDSVSISPAIIKIDVEGHELEVLSGLSESFGACRLCCVEIHQNVPAASARAILAKAGLQGCHESRRGPQIHLIARRMVSGS